MFFGFRQRLQHILLLVFQNQFFYYGQSFLLLSFLKLHNESTLVADLVICCGGLAELSLGNFSLPLHLVFLIPILLLHIFIMRKSSQSQVKSTQISSIILPKTSPLRVKLFSTQKYLSSPRSLDQSTVSVALSERASLTRQPRSFYNDRKKIYERRSRILSEHSASFRNTPMTMSERKRYETNRTEEVIGKRERLRSIEGETRESKKKSRSAALERFHNIAENKYKKLLYGQQMVKVHQQLLQKDIKMNLSEKNLKKWTSPFVGQSQSARLKGKPLISKSIDPLLPPSNPSHLKVLNLDRLFRVREGKLTNVVPLPVAKLSEVNSRQYLMKAVKNKDKIHEVIHEYNKLLKLSQLQRTKPRLGIRGQNFTKTPTIEELMGLKLAPSKSVSRTASSPLLEPQILMKHCDYFSLVKQDVHLGRRIIAGLVKNQNGGYLSLAEFTLFWQLFLSHTAKVQDKIGFLVYFMLPSGQDKVDLEVIRLVLQSMCKELPSIEKLDLKTDMLSPEEKSRIFLEALVRVLFGDVQLPEGRGLTRPLLRQILQNNPDACDLLVKLLQAPS